MHQAGSTDISVQPAFFAFLGWAIHTNRSQKRSFVMKADTRRQLKVALWGALGAFMVLAAIYVAF